MNNLSGVCIGTANFGKNYGKYNSSKLNKNEITEILKYCKRHNLNSIDTSFSYDNHKIIGSLKPKNWRSLKVNTKLPQRINLSEKKIYRLIDTALNDLNINKINTLYFHGIDSLLSKSGQEVFSSIQNLKKKKLINKVGISLSKTDSIFKFIKKYEFDEIQIPFNFADQTIFKKNKINILKKKKIKINIRSIFLQGSLLTNNLNKYKKNKDLYKYLSSTFKKISQTNIDKYDFALNFILKHNFYNKIILGIDNLLQLRKFHKFRKQNTKYDFSKISCSNKKVIYPFNWI